MIARVPNLPGFYNERGVKPEVEPPPERLRYDETECDPELVDDVAIEDRHGRGEK
jgi:hypothetical protein